MPIPGEAPSVVVLAGPNGAGKTTAAPDLLRGTLEVEEFINADIIAQGISGFRAEAVALEAGRIMLNRIRQLGEKRVSFAFETTLASRTFAPWIKELMETGYEFHLVFLSLRSADAAVDRVSQRIRLGGHAVPEETVRRRYKAGLRNFFTLYKPFATTWRFYDNSEPPPRIVAETGTIHDPELWARIERKWSHG